jgi:hypothetical protein
MIPPFLRPEGGRKGPGLDQSLRDLASALEVIFSATITKHIALHFATHHMEMSPKFWKIAGNCNLVGIISCEEQTLRYPIPSCTGNFLVASQSKEETYNKIVQNLLKP